MIHRAFLPFLRTGLLVAAVASCSAAVAQPAPADRQDAALAYAQCMRDNGFADFPDPTPDGNLQVRVNPETAQRFRAAGTACRDLAPEGFRDDDISPEDLEALVRLSQCVRENGLPDFPDPDADGRFDLSAVGVGPGDTRLEAAMSACRDVAGRRGGRIVIGG